MFELQKPAIVNMPEKEMIIIFRVDVIFSRMFHCCHQKRKYVLITVRPDAIAVLTL